MRNFGNEISIYYGNQQIVMPNDATSQTAGLAITQAGIGQALTITSALNNPTAITFYNTNTVGANAAVSFDVGDGTNFGTVFFRGQGSPAQGNGIPAGLCTVFGNNGSFPMVFNTGLAVRQLIDSDGSIQIMGTGGAAPTGGSKGVGTINAANGYYVNGVLQSLPVVFVKGADTSRTTVTATNDPDLVYAIPATGTYQIRAFLRPFGAGFSGNTPGFAANFNYSGTFSNKSYYAPLGSTNATLININTSPVSIGPNNGSYGFPLAVSDNSDFVIFEGTLIATTTGTLGIGWGQLNASANATTLHAGSYMTVTKLA